MKISKAIALLIMGVFLSACGGGSESGPAEAPPVVVPPPPVVKFGGFWFGNVVIDAATESEECGALVTEDGQFRFLCVFADLHLVGMSSTDQDVMTGSGQAFSSLPFLDGTFVSDLVVDATLVSGTSLVGTWSTASPGDSGSFDMVYDPEYEKPSSLGLLEGVWQSTDEFGNPNATYLIDDLGSFTAQDSDGCTASGMVLVLDSRYNLYQANSTIVGCPIAGDYSGLALVFDDFEANDSILLSINSDDRALLVVIQKTP
ncbi:MAG: hypothetical protein U5K38_11370 [Woeseiaceae bacterium]|nr:hypothetical protein [Woeseiaceae bacterium]